MSKEDQKSLDDCFSAIRESIKAGHLAVGEVEELTARARARKKEAVMGALSQKLDAGEITLEQLEKMK